MCSYAIKLAQSPYSLYSVLACDSCHTIVTHHGICLR